MRRTVTFEEDIYQAIQHYRAEFMLKGEDKTFQQALDELLRKALKLK